MRMTRTRSSSSAMRRARRGCGVMFRSFKYGLVLVLVGTALSAAALVWVEESRVVAADPLAGDGFGEALAMEGDTAIVGAPRHGEGGAVYVYARSGDLWMQRSRLAALSAVPDDRFGFALALD